MDNQQERIFAIGWVTGILEGEGWIMFVRRPAYKNNRESFRPVVGVRNTNMALMDRLAGYLDMFGLPYYVQSTQYVKHPEWKKQRTIYITGMKRVKKFVEMFIPYLVSKKRQAEIAKELIDYRFSVPVATKYSETEFRLFDELKSLNRKGNPQRLYVEGESQDKVRAA